MTTKKEFVLKYYDRLNDAGSVLSYALTAHAELHTKGWTDVSGLLGEERVIAAIDKKTKQIAGVIAFYELEDEKIFWIQLTYVTYVYRKMGVYKLMWKDLVKIAKEEQIRAIDGAHHVDNVAMGLTMRSVGRIPTFIFHRFDVCKP
jgi:predicted GNAT family acetyltransferase